MQVKKYETQSELGEQLEFTNIGQLGSVSVDGCEPEKIVEKRVDVIDEGMDEHGFSRKSLGETVYVSTEGRPDPLMVPLTKMRECRAALV